MNLFDGNLSAVYSQNHVMSKVHQYMEEFRVKVKNEQAGILSTKKDLKHVRGRHYTATVSKAVVTIKMGYFTMDVELSKHGRSKTKYMLNKARFFARLKELNEKISNYDWIVEKNNETNAKAPSSDLSPGPALYCFDFYTKLFGLDPQMFWEAPRCVPHKVIKDAGRRLIQLVHPDKDIQDERRHEWYKIVEFTLDCFFPLSGFIHGYLVRHAKDYL